MRNKVVKGKRVGIIILAIAVTVALLFTACAPGPAAQEQKAVRIGTINSLTGGGASSDQLSLMGFQDYVRHFNEEQGIPGWAIDVVWADGSGSTATFVSTYQRHLDAGITVMFSNAQWLNGHQSDLARDQVVMFTGNADQSLFYPAGWLYTHFPTWTEQFAAWADYVMGNWEEARPPRVAILGADAPFTQHIVPEATKYAESIGIEMLPPIIVPTLPLDTTTQLLHLKAQEADFVYIQWISVVTLPVLLDAERLELLDQIQFVGNCYSAGEKVFDRAGTASEGFLMEKTEPPLSETELPGIQLVRDLQMKYRGTTISEPEYIANWILAAVACEAVKRTGEQVGYENVDGAAVKEIADTIKDFDVYGLKTFTYTPDNHSGSRVVAVYEVRDGKLVRISDWKPAPVIMPGE
jgi:ABC-type branched-subunit amino acid transport system substrate-binding protein